MSSEEDAVRRVLEAFERSDWSEIDVRFGAVRVHLSTRSDGPTAVADRREMRSTETVETPAAAMPSTPDAGRPAERAASEVELPSGAQLVTSPSPGVFWHSPEPGAPPFAEIGGRVDASSTVGIVEVMKLMNHVKAGVAGEVVAVLVGNGVAVGQGEALIAVVPDGAGARM